MDVLKISFEESTKPVPVIVDKTSSIDIPTVTPEANKPIATALPSPFAPSNSTPTYTASAVATFTNEPETEVEEANSPIPTPSHSPTVTTTATINVIDSVSEIPTLIPAKIPTPTKTPTVTPTTTRTTTPSTTPTNTKTLKPTFTFVPDTATATPSLTPTVTITPKVVATMVSSQSPTIAAPEGKSLIGIDFIHSNNSNQIKVSFTERVSFKMVKEDSRKYKISVTGCALQNSGLLLPQFPPNDVIGFTLVRVAKTSSGLDVIVNLEDGMKATATNIDNSIVISSETAGF